MLKDAAGRFYVEDVCRFRAVPDEVALRIRRVAEADGTHVIVGLPRDPGQAGLHQIAVLTRSLAGWRVASSPEQGSKERRAGALQSQINGGNMRLRRASWNEAFLDELARFPGGKKDDQVDALSCAFSMLIEAAPAARYVSLPFLAR